MKRSTAVGMMLATLAATLPPGGPPVEPTIGPRQPRTGRNGMRREEKYSWNGNENERRRRQIERGIIKVSK